MIVVTGATGFLGKEVLLRLLQRREERIALLVRPSRTEDAETRARNVLGELFETGHSGLDRVSVIPGDIQRPLLGLSEAEFSSVAGETSEIFHCAASTNLGAPLEWSRAMNVSGTETMLQMARAAADFKCFHHVSTAFVAGDTERTVGSGDLDVGGRFKNSYEQSKAEAELLVRSSDLPHRIYRPSVIVGDSRTGKTSAFNVIYIPARLLVKGLLKALPISKSAPFDVVPVDYVADAIETLSRREAPNGTCYHLCAGAGRETTPWEIVETLFSTANDCRRQKIKRLTPPKLFSPETLHLITQSLSAAEAGMRNIERLFTKHREVFKQVVPFLPYMIRNPRFDTSNTREALSGADAPLFKDYADRIFRYCIDSNWGRR